MNGMCKTSGISLKDQIMGIEGDVQAKDTEIIFNKIIVENFSNLEKQMVIQVQEVFRTPNRQENKRTSPFF
jgi:hypothetical protein